MNKLTGIAASAGIAVARAFILEHPDYTITKTTVSDADAEIAKLDAALEKSKGELQRIKERTLAELGEKKAEIFESHLLILEDPELISPVKDKIREEAVNADYALQEVASQFIAMFENMKSAYLQERAADMRDVTKRVLNHLLGITYVSPAEIDEEVIVIAEDLTPSDTAQLNRKYVKGFTTNIGGRTSHSAIMARSLEIPAVVGTKSVLSAVKSGDLVIVDGLSGDVLINPDEAVVAEYTKKQEAYNLQIAEWKKLRGEPTVSKDGKHVELAANIGTPNDVAGVLENGGEGVGLYRTEFLYMGRDKLPS
ncbi:phosphoenolpyruvate--protein phosphotransferase, partial [Paenibacillus tengchongensis]|uniref:phosphoenolpyruvate--protein phosphotransferase n=1 Tax=Paenibacillus tengchongensis TaxID=2608684 RepID=UPI00124F689F